MNTFIQLGISDYWLMCDCCGRTNLSQYRFYIKENETNNSLGGYYCKPCKDKIERGEINVKPRSVECISN